MDTRHQRSVADRRLANRQVWKRAFGVSFVVHALIFLLWRTMPLPASPFAAAGDRNNDDLAAAGGMTAVRLPTATVIPIPPPLEPLPTLEFVDPVEFTQEVIIDQSSLIGDGPGELEGPGLADGRGLGDGGTAAEGLFELVPATPRGMIMPPTNSSLRGRSVNVWVFVDAAGRVVADSTRLDPPTSDRDFNRRLVAEAADWVFRPATKGGEPVASWFPYTIRM